MEMRTVQERIQAKIHTNKEKGETEMNLSVVIPAFNEEKRISNTLLKTNQYLKSKKFKFEIIVVNDASEDNTLSILNKSKIKNLKVITNHKNSGKGYSIRTGFFECKYDTVLVMDADLATPINQLIKLTPFMKNHDVVIGSRNMKNSKVLITQNKIRQFFGKIYPKLVSAFVLKGFKDTQCGFKLFNARAVDRIKRRGLFDRFSFDVEAILIAQRYGFKVVEVPVVWIDKPGSKVHLIRDSVTMLISLGIIKLRDLQGVYVDKGTLKVQG